MTHKELQAAVDCMSANLEAPYQSDQPEPWRIGEQMGNLVQVFDANGNGVGIFSRETLSRIKSEFGLPKSNLK